MTATGTVLFAGSRRTNVALLMLAAFIALSKVTLTLVEVATAEAPFAGEMLVIVGGV